jgi:hypothetical protein
VLGNLQIEFFRAERPQKDTASAVIRGQRHESRHAQGKYRGKGKCRARRRKCIEIKVIDGSADE